jgi:hypothetical protein
LFNFFCYFSVGIIPAINRMFCVNAKCPGKDVDGNRFVLNSEKEQYLALEKEREEKKKW